MATIVEQLTERRNILLNQFGHGPANDGAVRDAITRVENELLKHNVGTCSFCNVAEHLNLLDGQPDIPENAETADHNKLACIECCGPGWNPMAGPQDFKLSIHPRFAPLYKSWAHTRTIIDSQAKRISELKDALAAAGDEIYAANVYIMDFGKLQCGTPQSRRLVNLMAPIKALIGCEPKRPKDYPHVPVPEIQ